MSGNKIDEYSLGIPKFNTAVTTTVFSGEWKISYKEPNKFEPEQEIENAIKILQNYYGLDFTNTINILRFAHADITMCKLNERIKEEIYGSKS